MLVCGTLQERTFYFFFFFFKNIHTTKRRHTQRMTLLNGWTRFYDRGMPNDAL